MGATAISSGARGLPIWWAIKGIALALEDDDEPIHVEGAIRSFLTETYSKEVSHAVMDGAIDSLTGLTASTRMSLSNLFYRDTEKSMEGPELTAHLTQELLGPIFGGLAASAGMAAYDMSRGQTWLAAERLSPTIVKGWLQAERMKAEGLRNRTGEQILDKEEFNLWDKWKRRSGFTLDKVTMAYRRNEVAHTIDADLEARKSKLTARWVLARDNENVVTQKRIEKEIDAYNSKQSSNRDKIHKPRLFAAYRSRKTRQRSSAGGVTPRARERAEGSSNF
jgi:hypothetical protein